MLCELENGETLADAIWPVFSQRAERGLPAFQDPVENTFFWVRFDWRFEETAVLAASLESGQ